MGILYKEFAAYTKEQLDSHALTYVLEAEHQDGPEYWNQFETVEEAFNDFVLYLGNVTGVIS
jgi:hypothetical protein